MKSKRRARGNKMDARYVAASPHLSRSSLVILFDSFRVVLTTSMLHVDAIVACHREDNVRIEALHFFVELAISEWEARRDYLT